MWSPLEFLQEEISNVERVLGETLRYDYGPERSLKYYNECAARLTEIEKAISGVAPDDLQTISAHLNELSLLAAWISLIERSHLGEFSWPFADEIRQIAATLLAETTLKGDPVEPIIGEDVAALPASALPALGSLNLLDVPLAISTLPRPRAKRRTDTTGAFS